jgi:hypothetical protein
MNSRVSSTRKIYGPVETEEGWRIRNNDEFEKNYERRRR